MMRRELTPSSRSASTSARADALDDDGEGHAARHVALRVEEHLDVPRAVGVRAPQVGGGELVEVLLA